MKQHKWHKEIKAWADGAEIEWKYPDEDEDEWAEEKSNPDWEDKEKEYRIKPQPKEPQYLYAYFDPNIGDGYITANPSSQYVPSGYRYIGKIKLEVEE